MSAHGPDHDCSDCAIEFRQGRSTASQRSSVIGFVFGLACGVALAIVAIAKLAGWL